MDDGWYERGNLSLRNILMALIKENKSMDWIRLLHRGIFLMNCVPYDQSSSLCPFEVHRERRVNRNLDITPEIGQNDDQFNNIWLKLRNASMNSLRDQSAKDNKLISGNRISCSFHREAETTNCQTAGKVHIGWMKLKGVD